MILTDFKHLGNHILRYKIRIQGLRKTSFGGTIFRLVFHPVRTVTHCNPRFYLLEVFDNIKQVYIIDLWCFWWLFYGLNLRKNFKGGHGFLC